MVDTANTFFITSSLSFDSLLLLSASRVVPVPLTYKVYKRSRKRSYSSVQNWRLISSIHSSYSVLTLVSKSCLASLSRPDFASNFLLLIPLSHYIPNRYIVITFPLSPLAHTPPFDLT